MTLPAGEVTVVHAIPGRVRLRVPGLRRRPDLAASLADWAAGHDGIRSVRVDPRSASVIVQYEPSRDIDAIRAAVLARSRAAPEARRIAPTAMSLDRVRRLLPIGLGVVAAATGLVGLLPATLASGLALASAVPIAARALSTLLRDRRPSVDQLDAAAVTVLVLIGDATGAAFMSALVAIGEEIRELTARRSRAAALDLQAALGRSAWVVRDDREVRVPVSELARGDVVAVYPGDVVPIDGTVRSGEGAVDQHAITGESRPIYREARDPVLAGSVLTDGALRVHADAVGDQTRAGWIVRALEAAPDTDTRAASYANRVADRLVVPTFLLAGAAYALTGDPLRAASVLIVDFATGIRVSTPTAILATISRAASEGILIRSGRAIERLAQADVFVFDKTGTLTSGRPSVEQVIPLNGVTPRRLLAFASAVEMRLKHPTARAIAEYARRHDIRVPARHDPAYRPGLGAAATVEGHRVYVGSERFLASEGVRTAGADIRSLRRGGRSIVGVAIDRDLVGLLACRDTPREHSRSVLRWLRESADAEILLVTGDEPGAARAIGRHLGITRVHPETMPDEKRAIVHRLLDDGHVVAVVGDGINDSPALAAADVSICVNGGADVARETADIVLDRGIEQLPVAIALARQAQRLIRQDLSIVAVPNAFGLALGALGIVPPVGATVLNNGSGIAAALNSLRPLLPGSTRVGE